MRDQVTGSNWPGRQLVNRVDIKRLWRRTSLLGPGPVGEKQRLTVHNTVDHMARRLGDKGTVAGDCEVIRSYKGSAQPPPPHLDHPCDPQLWSRSWL